MFDDHGDPEAPGGAGDVAVANHAEPTETADQQCQVLRAALKSEAVRTALLAAQLGPDSFSQDASKLVATAVANVPWASNYPARVRKWITENKDSDQLYPWAGGLKFAVKRTKKAETA